MPQPCSVSGCERKYYAKGWCEMHYQRVAKYGDPEAGRTHAPPEVRFWRMVNRAAPDECWLWTGKTGGKYGQFQVGGKGSPATGAHRYSHFMATGEHPEVVMHRCDTPLCVNPAHLMPGSYQANMDDMHAKGRARPGRALGAANYNTKLKPDDIRAIRQRQGESAGSVGRAFGVDHKAILAIWRGITWKHVT